MKKHPVAEIMTRDVVTTSPTTGYRDIVETLARHGVSALPVVDDDRRVLGVVSEADLLYKVEYAGQGPSAQLFGRRRSRRAREKADADTAAELMTTPAVVARHTATVAEAARLMDLRRVKRLPVVDETEHLVGVVARCDVLRLYLRTDDDIRSEIRDDVLLRTLWIDPARVALEVHDGVVTLGGVVERRSGIPVIGQIVAGVPGVIEVVNHLGYALDDVRGAA
jgi:CBS domain-containing protein